MKTFAALLFAATIPICSGAIRFDQPIISADHDVQLTIQGDVGAEYSIEWSLNLINWNLLTTGIAVNGSLTAHHDASAYSTIFYRAKGAAVADPLSIYPQSLSLNAGAEGAFVALRASSSVAWSSSNPNIASVDTNGVVKAVAKGSVTITASSAGQSDSATVAVYDTSAASPDKFSSTLIAEALARNEITAEQALIYRTYAAFGDNRLPAQFRGAPSDGANDSLLREVVNVIETLSPDAQQILRPFLLPPVYAESWSAQQLGLTATGQGGAGGSAETSVNCSATSLPQWYSRVSTAHFNVFYLKLNDLTFDRGSQQLADIVSSIAEEIYTAETGLLQRFPLPDTNEGCNGGDGAVDIYISPINNPTLYGLTVPYRSGCAKTPSYIVLNRFGAPLFYASGKDNVSEGTPLVKAVLAHEFMHVLQLAMDRVNDCEDLKWFDEATAQWAVDLVDGAANLEDGFIKKSSKKKRSGSFFTEYLLADHTASLEMPGPAGDADKNGYVDYIFFQFLARKYSPAAIKQIFDATAGASGKRSVEAIAAALGSYGGFKQVWPEFARTLWNDTSAPLLNFWNTQDQYDFGLQYIFSPEAGEFRDRAGDRLQTIRVDQKGASKAKFILLKAALTFELDPSGVGSQSYQIEPRSFICEHLKFVDPTVHSALLVNPIASYPAAMREFIKVYAWTKIGGVWKAPEDWTAEPYKQFCLDKKDERLEEMLLIVSNSQADRGAEQPFMLSDDFPMQLSTSNVGCWQWEGSASMEYTNNDGVRQTASAVQVKWEVLTNIPGRIYFETTAGSAVGSQFTPIADCSITSTASQGPIRKRDVPDGNLDYNLDLDLGFNSGSDRNLVTLIGSTSLSTVNTFQCPDFSQSSTADQAWFWVNTGGKTNLVVSADGQTIEGNLTEPVPAGGTQRIIYRFTSKREE